MQAQMDSAIHPRFGNPMTDVSRIQVPPGAVMYEGAAAPQGFLLGGGNQIYIPNISTDWIVR
jgi:hypothetical protein